MTAQQLKSVPVTNVLTEYKTLTDEIKRLEKLKDAAKSEIFLLMDACQSDLLTIGGVNAERKLVVQERIDSKLVKELLGPDYHKVCKETSQIRLLVV